MKRSRVRVLAGTAGEVFFFWGQLSVLTLFWYPFHLRVTAVARKDPGPSAKRAGQRQVAAKHTCILRV